MPATSINPSPKGCLLFLFPAALIISAFLVGWRYILGFAILITAGSIWQSYQWSQATRAINPIFQQAIVENRGEISPLDLSLKANISGTVAKKYLDAKAQEFGTRPRQHPDRGPIYYFVSVTTLGSILDDSELAAEPLELPVAESTVALQPAPEPTIAPPPPSVESAETSEPPAPAIETPPSPHANLGELLTEDAPPETEEQPPALAPDCPLETIIQSELAKRLDVHSSTVYKRRSDPDFTDWTRNRDPEGCGWAYSSESKEYYKVG
jgi:hypothetical protein